MRILDLFCGAGGASYGLRKQFPAAQITGVDVVFQKRYPFTFIQADALSFPLLGFDFIWASPPCQIYSRLKGLVKKDYPDLISVIRERLHRLLHQRAEGAVATVIENVTGAPLVDPVMLCGSMFGLGVWRHRIFECSFPVRQSSCNHASVPLPIDVTGTGGPYKRAPGKRGGASRKPRNIRHAREVMGISWMTRKELNQAIPPAYSQYLGAEWRRELWK